MSLPVRVSPTAQVLAGSAADQTRELLQRLNNLVEWLPDHGYTIGKTHKFVTLRAVTPCYVKAISAARAGREFYFPVQPVRTRRGVYFRILSILQRDDPNAPVKWNAQGMPTANATLIDPMLETVAGAVRDYRCGYFFAEVDKIYTK